MLIMNEQEIQDLLASLSDDDNAVDGGGEECEFSAHETESEIEEDEKNGICLTDDPVGMQLDSGIQTYIGMIHSHLDRTVGLQLHLFI